MPRKSKAVAKPRNAKLPPRQTVTPAELEALAARQGVKPVTDPTELLGDFWPDDESADDFLQAVKRWRREGRELQG